MPNKEIFSIFSGNKPPPEQKFVNNNMSTVDNLDEMDQFLERHHLPKSHKKKQTNPNRSILLTKCLCLPPTPNLFIEILTPNVIVLR